MLEVLNVNAGDMKFNFDSNDPQEVARAERVVQDMLQRGYMLFVEVDGKLERCLSFNKERCEYVIADGPGPVGHIPEPIPTLRSDRDTTPKNSPTKGQKSKARTGTRGVSAKTAKATAIPRTSGG